MSKKEEKALVTKEEIKAMKKEELEAVALELLGYAEESKKKDEVIAQQQQHIDALASVAVMIRDNNINLLNNLQSTFKANAQLNNVGARSLENVLPPKFRQPQQQ